MAEIQKSQVNDMVAFYESGIKQDQHALGVELEYTLVKNNGEQVKYDDEFGQKWLMEQLKSDYPTSMLDEVGHLIGIKNDRDSVTLEPAGQFELSAGPFNEIQEVRNTFLSFITRISKLVVPHDMFLHALGYHPSRRAEELEIIPKVRYGLMNEYFLNTSPLGIRMMRATGSTQVSIDYDSEADCVRKLRLAYLCVPIFALLTDNTPYFEGHPRTHHLMRTEVWEDCDKSRCGLVPGVLSPDFCFEKYATYVLSSPAMFEMYGSEGHVSGRPITEVYKDKEMGFEQCANASSHLFNDVRLKNFIEIRPADALPIDHMSAYVALIKGLFYGSGTLDALEELFGSQSEEAFESAKFALKQDGFDAIVYGMNADALSKKIIEIAERGLLPHEQRFLGPLHRIAEDKMTLADRLVPL